MSGKVRVGVNGYGVIGKRVADAVSLQDDMQLVGVTFNHFDYRIQVAAERGYPIYACSSEGIPAGLQSTDCVRGTIDDLLRQVDVMVDCTAKGVAAANKEIYEKAGIKAIFQGGEKHQLAGVSFTAQANYSEALNRQFVRVSLVQHDRPLPCDECFPQEKLGQEGQNGHSAEGQRPMGEPQSRNGQYACA